MTERIEWLRWVQDDTLHNMHRDLLRHGVFDGSREGEQTGEALKAIEYEAGVRALRRSTTAAKGPP